MASRFFVRSMFVSTAVIACVALESMAHAQTIAPHEQAAALILEGRTLLAQGQAQDALSRFTRAYELGRFATARAHMGVAEGALGHPVEAERYLREALEAPTDALMQPTWAERFRENLRVAQRSVGQFTARANVAGARVSLNGREVGTIPFAAPIRVRAETVHMRVTADGFYPLERDVIIGGELAVTTENIELNAVVTEPSRTVTNSASHCQPTSQQTVERPVIRPVVAPVVSSAQPTVVIVNREGSEGRPSSGGASSTLIGLAIASGALAVVGFGVGGAGVGIAQHNAAEYQQADCANRTGVPECGTALQYVSLGTYLEIGGFVGAGLFTVGSIALAIGASRSAPAARPTTASTATVASWSCGAGLGAVLCAGRF